MSGCAALPEVTADDHVTDLESVEVGFGPEDFVVDWPDTFENPRLLVACDERRKGETPGEIWEVDFENKTSRKLEIVFKDTGVNFHPHGIDKYGDYLFVISHNGKKEEFYRFIIEADRLIEDTVFTEGIIGQGNDIFAVGENEFYYSDFKALGGSVVHYFEGEYEKVIKHLKYPNGIYVIRDDIYVSTTLQNKVFKYDLLEGGKKEVIARVKGGDNLMYDGIYLYTTSHPKFGKFIQHARHPGKISPSVVYRIGGEEEVIYSNPGEEISAASVALQYEGYFFIGQVIENFILVGKVPK